MVIRLAAGRKILHDKSKQDLVILKVLKDRAVICGQESKNLQEKDKEKIKNNSFGHNEIEIKYKNQPIKIFICHIGALDYTGPKSKVRFYARTLREKAITKAKVWASEIGCDDSSEDESDEDDSSTPPTSSTPTISSTQPTSANNNNMDVLTAALAELLKLRERDPIKLETPLKSETQFDDWKKEVERWIADNQQRGVSMERLVTPLLGQIRDQKAKAFVIGSCDLANVKTPFEMLKLVSLWKRGTLDSYIINLDVGIAFRTSTFLCILLFYNDILLRAF